MSIETLIEGLERQNKADALNVGQIVNWQNASIGDRIWAFKRGTWMAGVITGLGRKRVTVSLSDQHSTRRHYRELAFRNAESTNTPTGAPK